MNITGTINRAVTAHQLMKEQAGKRMIVTFECYGDSPARHTSHFGTVDEVIQEWDRLLERFDDVSIMSAHSDVITQRINELKHD